jgi:hypothetical protein
MAPHTLLVSKAVDLFAPLSYETCDTSLNHAVSFPQVFTIISKKEVISHELQQSCLQSRRY